VQLFFGVLQLLITHLGAAMVLLEIGSLRLLTDHVFDDTVRFYSFGSGTGSKNLTNPACHSGTKRNLKLTREDIGRIDAVLLSYDNLDYSGRAFLPNAGVVLTTVSLDPNGALLATKLTNRGRGTHQIAEKMLKAL
jgi:L-ascorbate metabolism protein UlaG (beta-lactamase superfamily)